MIQLITYFGAIGPIQILIGGILYLIFTISALVLALKNETSVRVFLWILMILFLPFFGSLIYLMKRFINKKKASNTA
ncbi:PLDc N-terminal domain-containing protein [Subsaxibacter sp. CAU 1640]|uniref:PLDc N-terminal domain-containing protein n=1 Tax=Subsaxibacter sp. CAU 1640 TaxID=2933271 RepID=UPI002003EA3A|nr:PLDc N-terminal domain-containing protein [Subsaxibacter sp. CAU 1640]MCK7591097.1 PLDc N-terminal domain-containing protein [Subsaxibacter sp. CAU 1640]